MDRGFFEEIGAFDEGMKLWGGENIDLAIRVCLSCTIIHLAELCFGNLTKVTAKLNYICVYPLHLDHRERKFF